MLLLPSPKRLLVGYLLGALTVSMTLGLTIVFFASKSSLIGTAEHTINPLLDITVGVLILIGTSSWRPAATAAVGHGAHGAKPSGPTARHRNGSRSSAAAAPAGRSSWA